MLFSVTIRGWMWFLMAKFSVGYDAFGLPTENFAIKNHIHPRIVTENHIKNFRRQL